MGQALYRKYRSKKLSEIVGQEHITETLGSALKQGRISHAYLFTGPRGVGKTSIARILAHEINDLPYTNDSPHMDIIEIDAASNRRIDEIRDLRERVHVAPTTAKYKVYIIDEVHMLTKEAFNALLKTLEEPPAHVVFILATTDAHKLPETIVSRTQRYVFRPVEKTKVIDHLSTIAQTEKIKISPTALNLLAEHGDGSFRDSISLLDQASSQGKAIELDDVQQLLGIPPEESVAELIACLSDADSSAVMQKLNQLYLQGFQAAAVAKQIGQSLRKQLIEGNLMLDSNTALQLLETLIEVPAAHQPERLLEVCLLRVLLSQSASAAPPATGPQSQLQTAAIEAVEAVMEAEGASSQDDSAELSKPADLQAMDQSIWPDVLDQLKKKRNTLYGVVRMATPVFADDGSLKLVFSFAFHQKRSNEAANRQLLADIIKEITGKDVSIEVVLDAGAKPAPAIASKKTGPKADDLSAISNIFGDAKLLES